MKFFCLNVPRFSAIFLVLCQSMISGYAAHPITHLEICCLKIYLKIYNSFVNICFFWLFSFRRPMNKKIFHFSNEATYPQMNVMQGNTHTFFYEVILCMSGGCGYAKHASRSPILCHLFLLFVFFACPGTFIFVACCFLSGGGESGLKMQMTCKGCCHGSFALPKG